MIFSTMPTAAASVRPRRLAMTVMNKNAIWISPSCSAIGPPLRSSFVKLLGEASADRAVSLYRERFSDIGLYENRVYDGIGEILTTLGQSGHRLFVATSKAHVFADRIIDHFGLRPHFGRVFGAELDGTRADHGRVGLQRGADVGQRRPGGVVQPAVGRGRLPQPTGAGVAGEVHDVRTEPTDEAYAGGVLQRRVRPPPQ